ncbi:type I restriction enzyme, S subunit [Candidatus Magnetomoraceae bacterium gMMP-13]
MELRDGYKKTEVGVIPEDWEVKNLGEIGSFSKGIGIKKDQSNSGNIPCVRYGELYTRHNDFIKQFYSFISEEVSQTSKKLETGDILFAGSGETKEEIGKCSAFINDFEAYAGGDIVILSPFNISSLFLGFLLNSANIQKQKASRGQGDAVVHISASQLKQIKIPLPPLPEQKAIAEVLSDTDNLIQALEKRIAKKRLIKQGAMQKLLTPKDDWEVKKLGEMGTFKNGVNKSSENFGFGYPFVNLMDVFGKTTISNSEHLGLVNSNETERKMYELKKGDVLFIRSSVKPEGVGLTCLIKNNLKETVFSGFIIRYRDNGVLCNEYKEHCFHSSYFRKKLIESSTVSANTNINQEALKKLTISYPISKFEQTRIATILSDMDNEIKAVEKKLAKYKMLKQGLMQNLLTGKIRLI